VCLLGRELTLDRRHHLERLRLLALRHGQVHDAEPAGRESLGERIEVAVRDLIVGDHEGALGALELGQVLGGVGEQSRSDRHVVRAAWDRDAYALHRRSSRSMATATSSTVPLPSTTCAANSR